MKMKLRSTIYLALALILTGCSYSSRFKGDAVVGADDFIIDSYKIKEGKLSILEMEGKPLMELDPALLKEYSDTIQEGDGLSVGVYHPSRCDLVAAVQSIGASVGYHVREGKIILPDLQPIEIVGLTIEAAREKIQNAYDREIDDVEVFLAYKHRELGKVQLSGLVHVPSVPVDGKVRLFETLSQAGIPTNANLFKSYLVRGNDPIPVDMYKLMREGDMSQNVVMRGGDKLYIASPATSSVMVTGEVLHEKVIELSSGVIPLREALTLAGGIPFTGDKGCIQVIRGNILRPKIYTLNWRHVMRLPTTSLLLMAGDVVYVAPTPLTEWNRFVQQVLPTLTGIELFRKGTAGVIVQ